MNGIRQSRLVAIRELRERSRSRAFRVSVVVMILVVVGVLLLPALFTGSSAKHVGLTGAVSNQLSTAIGDQATAAGTTARLRHYNSVDAGEQALRHGDIVVLVVNSERLEWRRQIDEQLRAVITGAIQLVTVKERAAAGGMSPADLSSLLAPVPINNVELGSTAGRSRDDETAAFIMTVLLFMAIATYAAMVLSGVVEEKSSRIVEVLLTRMPARNLLAGKIAGIGLLGLAQFGVTVLAALIAVTTVKSIDLPSLRASVLAWLIVWFVLGYTLYATVYGALGSLASRAEDAQSVAGPVSVVLIAAYLVSFATIGSPDSAWARLVSYVPATAPLAMPNRIAMGAVAWWEPLLTVGLTLAAIAGLVHFGGRVYAGAILHTGPTLKISDAWRGMTSSPSVRPGTASHRLLGSRRRGHPTAEAAPPEATNRLLKLAPIGIGAGVGAVVGLLVSDFIVGLAVAAASYAAAITIARSWSRGGDQHRNPPGGRKRQR